MKPFLLRLNALCFILIGLAFLALANCSGSDDTPLPSSGSSGEQQYWCVYSDIKQCLYGFSEECPGNGVLAFGCPYSSSSSETGNARQNWCVYLEAQLCFPPGSFIECVGDGILALGCPYSSSGAAASSPSQGSSPSSSEGSSSSVGSSSSAGGGPNPPPPASTTGPVACYGKLKASGRSIIGSKSGSNPVQVRGVSLGWSNTGWESARFFDAATVNAMVDSWRAEIIRAPMGYSESGGYKTDPSNKTRVETVVNAAIEKGVYVIIDWHSHSAHSETAAAKAFFTEMAQKYGSYDNVIFEVYNEPLNITWATIKSYATEIISAIRTYSDNLILVGTPKWDQDINVVTSSTKIDDPNVAYVLHFYAAEHPLSNFQSKANSALSAGVPIFVSEYGTVMADGDGAHSAANTNSWMTYLDNNKISSCAWSVNDKKEGAAFFGTGSAFNKTSWTATSSMTASGQYIYNKLTSYYADAPWRACSFSDPSSSSGEPMNCSISSYCYDIPDATECMGYGGTPSACAKMAGCGNYCRWDTGCFEIVPDPAGVYGAATSNCSAAQTSCSRYGLGGPYSNSNCSGGSTASYCHKCGWSWGANYCFRIGSSDCSALDCAEYGTSVTLSWCEANGKIVYD